MKAVIQRVRRASVAVDDHVIGEIERGVLIYLGVGPDDGPDQVAWLVDKIANVRIFDAPAGAKTTLSVKDVGGAALVISQLGYACKSRLSQYPHGLKAFEWPLNPHHRPISGWQRHVAEYAA